jgi:hypothetical protein
MDVWWWPCSSRRIVIAVSCGSYESFRTHASIYGGYGLDSLHTVSWP